MSTKAAAGVCVCVCGSDFDVIDEAQVFSLNGLVGPDERRVRLGFLLLSLLHPAGGLPAGGSHRSGL